jgi:hypothetical protein
VVRSQLLGNQVGAVSDAPRIPDVQRKNFFSCQVNSIQSRPIAFKLVDVAFDVLLHLVHEMLQFFLHTFFRRSKRHFFVLSFLFQIYREKIEQKLRNQVPFFAVPIKNRGKHKTVTNKNQTPVFVVLSLRSIRKKPRPNQLFFLIIKNRNYHVFFFRECFVSLRDIFLFDLTEYFPLFCFHYIYMFYLAKSMTNN